ncbi:MULTISPECIES: M20/M25/M40 family metallo-hydrolase [Bacillus]|uniref:Peptidase M20 n=1 Tax=Bacillus infantis NRRL B-14911 TaxID=1367477 RepID=U5LE27_9BACI|nr:MULTISPECIES: M20/M25/M40 family metallo-hydrolase [Bacillus]AGX04961.1 peptidase M20 [Bacillus infantis NRRL B-14911]EAR67943.1 peptidase [Bacillus sp. NRRL B-14911]MCA1035360.1 M20/M25/M40 family metallo-hydrolase [Bacillus infantis]
MAENIELKNSVAEALEKIAGISAVQKGLSFLKNDNDRTSADQKELTSIPAPTFEEGERGEYYRRRLEELGIEDISKDDAGNIFGLRKGTGNGPRIAVCAHLDTVFPAGTDTVPKVKDGKIYAPGIADDGRGLAAVLTLIRAFNETGIETEGDILFGATVGEEGLGDLNGVKALFGQDHGIDGFISIEPGSPERITYLAAGSKRYEITYKGSGGHSFGDFGTPSAIHAAGKAIAGIADLKVPEDPKTTFNVGIVSGGTSVNTIAAEARLIIDLRSVSADELARVESEALSIIKEAAGGADSGITVEIKQVGDRPAGSQDMESAIVQTAAEASRQLGFIPSFEKASSTDSNVPIALGIPAVTLGGGGSFGGIHTLEEYFDPQDAYYGPQAIFLCILGLTGIKGISSPVLDSRRKNNAEGGQ